MLQQVVSRSNHYRDKDLSSFIPHLFNPYPANVENMVSS